MARGLLDTMRRQGPPRPPRRALAAAAGAARSCRQSAADLTRRHGRPRRSGHHPKLRVGARNPVPNAALGLDARENRRAPLTKPRAACRAARLPPGLLLRARPRSRPFAGGARSGRPLPGPLKAGSDAEAPAASFMGRFGRSATPKPEDPQRASRSELGFSDAAAALTQHAADGAGGKAAAALPGKARPEFTGPLPNGRGGSPSSGPVPGAGRARRLESGRAPQAFPRAAALSALPRVLIFPSSSLLAAGFVFPVRTGYNAALPTPKAA
jgi:hypothetical protein